MQFGFWPKMYYLCLTKEERALDVRVLSSFFAKNLTDKGCFTSDIGKNTSEIIFFLGFIVEFFRQVVLIMSDVEPQKVKRHESTLKSGIFENQSNLYGYSG